MGGIVDAIFGNDDPPPAPDYVGAAQASGAHAIEVAKIGQATAEKQIASAEKVAAASTATREAALKLAQTQAADVKALGERGLKIQEAGLAFQKQQYTDWDAIYGPIQENLGDYYKKLTPAKVISQGLQAEQKSYQQAVDKLKVSLAQRGIDPTSGVAVGAETALRGQSYQTKAGIRATGEERVAAQKSQFLGLGLGQGTAMLGTIAQQQGTVGSAFQGVGGQMLQGGQLVQGAYGGLATGQMQGGQLVGQGYQTLGQGQMQLAGIHGSMGQSYISGGASIYGAQAGYSGGGGLGKMIGSIGGAWAGSEAGATTIGGWF